MIETSTTGTANRRETVLLKQLSVPSPWKGVLLPLSAIPTPEEELASVRVFLQRLVSDLKNRSTASLETFLQFANLHLAGGASRLSSHGGQWAPAMGLGVWPDREPPTRWTVQELTDLMPGEKVRPLMNIIVRVSGSAEAREQARNVMLGIGTVIQFVGCPANEELLPAARQLLWPTIKDLSFTSFAFYVPLLEVKSVSQATGVQLESWSCGAHAYIRESPEDNGILIVSKTLDEALVGLGGSRADESGDWHIPNQFHAAD